MRDRDVLNYNPFEGDRDSNVKLLSDRMLVGRKWHQCNICWGPIAKGERHRARTEIDRDDDRAGTFRFCAKCCEAMAVSWKDDGRAICERTAIGMHRANIWRVEMAIKQKQLSDTHQPEPK